jgi:hypothetical protein
MRRQIQVELKLQMGQRVSTSRVRVGIEEPVGAAIEGIERLYSCECVAALRGQALDRSQTFVQAQVKDNETIFLFGVVANALGLSSNPIRFFKRFKDFKPTDSWYVGEGKWDAILFIPTKTIRVFGIGIFEKHANGGPMKLGYKYILEDLAGAEIMKTEVVQEDVEPIEPVEGHIIKHLFKNNT